MSGTEGSYLSNDEFIEFTGCETVHVQKILSSIKDSFTYELWVKPFEDLEVQTESTSGWAGTEGQKFVISAENSMDSDAAGAGVSVGKNGISVYEHSVGYLPAVLVFSTSISDWTHVAVVYNNRTPYLYVNGALVKQGFTSPKSTVYASGVFGGLNPYGFFVGQLREVRIWDHARNEEQIRLRMYENLTGKERGLFGLWRFSRRLFISDMTGHGNHGTLQLSHYLRAVLTATHHTNTAYDSSRTVDIIIPVYNSLDETKKCIESVYSNSDLPYNLYLINDCSSDANVYSYLEGLRSSETPTNLQNLFIIHNDRNEGFVSTVNKGMSLSNHDVILLNSDTEVPPGWMSRIMSPFSADDKIASVTPFSNSATLCSFPEIFRDNLMPCNMGVDQVDELFRRYGTDLPVEIPTAVGFCMAIRRQSLDKIGLFDDVTFGMGYGEENDWCMRAHIAGLKHVLIPNLFVFHKGSASFIDNERVNRESQMQKNLWMLQSKYPTYQHMVQSFLREDPARVIREVISSTMVIKNSHHRGVLFLLHNNGGGTEHFQNQYIEKIRQQTRVYRLRHVFNTFVLDDLNHDAPISFNFDTLDEQTFQKLLSHFHIDLVHVDHLLSFPLLSFLEVIQKSGVDYHFFLHDFFSVCPVINLLNHHGMYCHDETNAAVCQDCLNHFDGVDITSWRQRFSSFLKGAKKVIAPSANTKKIVNKYYPELAIDVQEHTLPGHVHYTFDEQFIEDQRLNIAVVGRINYHKGLQILYQLKEMICEQDILINIRVIGTTDFHPGYFLTSDGKFMVTGPFKNEDISDLLALYRISIVMIPSIWPETYSYTTSEALMSGYPVMSFNLGAPSDRIVKYDGGWLLDQIDAKSILQLLRRLLHNRKEILQKANHLRDAFQPK